MTNVFSLHGSIAQYWKAVLAEYKRLAAEHGVPPFEFEFPNPGLIDINQYLPKNGEDIVLNFWDRERTRILLVVEMESAPDEPGNIVQVFVHPQVNVFEDPGRSAIAVWRGIKRVLKKTGKWRAGKTAKPKKKRGRHERTSIAINRLYEIHAEAAKSKAGIIPRKDALKQVGIASNTWRNNERELWDHWEDKSYKTQNMQ